MHDEFVYITKELFEQKLKEYPGHDAFIAQRDFENEFPTVVAAMIKRKRKNIGVVTEPLSSLARAGVSLLAAKYGCRLVSVDDMHEKMEYLGSNHGGHYSIDYYRVLRYALVRLVVSGRKA